MDPITIGLIASGVLAAGGGLLSFFGARRQSQTNQQIANQNLQVQQTENEITRAREDNAVQRAARDMELAGLSKTLAAGRPASAQALTAPKNEFQEQNFGQAALQGISQGAQVAQQIAQVQNTVANTQHTNLVNANYERKLNSDINVQESQARLYKAEAKLKEFEGEHQAEKFEKEMDNLIAKTLRNIESALLSKKEREYVAQKVVNDIIRNERISSLTEKTLVDIAKVKLENDVLEHNLFIARASGTNVGEQPKTSVGRFFRSFNIANGNQAISVGFTPDSLGVER